MALPLHHTMHHIYYVAIAVAVAVVYCSESWCEAVGKNLCNAAEEDNINRDVG